MTNYFLLRSERSTTHFYNLLNTPGPVFTKSQEWECCCADLGSVFDYMDGGTSSEISTVSYSDALCKYDSADADSNELNINAAAG